MRRTLAVTLAALALPSAAAAATWGSPEVVYTGSAGDVRVGIDAEGDGVVAFVSPYGSRDPARVDVADVPAAGAPGTPVSLSTDGEHAFLRGLAVAPDGQAAVAWEEGEYQHHAVMLSTRAPGGDWTPARRISPAGNHYALGDLIIEPGGTIVAAWTFYTGYDEGGMFLTPGTPPRVELARVTGDAVDIERLPKPGRRPALAASEVFPHAAVSWERPGKFGPHSVGHRDVMLRVAGRTIRVRGHKVYMNRTVNFGPAVGADAVVAAAAPLRRGFVVVRVDKAGHVSRRRVHAPPFVKTRDVAVAGSRAVVGFTHADPANPDPIRPAVIDAGVHDLDASGDSVGLAAGGGRVAAVWRGPPPSNEDDAWGIRASVAEPGEPFGSAETVSSPDEWPDPPVFREDLRIALNAAGAGLVGYAGRDRQYGQAPARITVVRLLP